MSDRIILIAEAGVNHNGSIEIARKLIDVAAYSGVDYIKFQSFDPDKLVSSVARKAVYQVLNSAEVDDTQYDMLSRLKISKENHIELINYCRKKKIGFLSSAFDEDGIDFLLQLDIPFFKIPSGEITNKPYLQYISTKGKPVIMSTGMASIKEVKKAISILIDGGIRKSQITVLHCNTEYPTPMHDVNLKAMLTIKKELDIKIGYSDHTLGIEIPIAAVAMGAKVIEKHITLDRNLPGPDHSASLEPHELNALVEGIRNVELALSGDGIKRPSSSEIANINIVRKSIHIYKPINPGDVVTREHLIMKRPGDGISPMQIDQVIGKTCKVSLKTDDKLQWEYLEKI